MYIANQEMTAVYDAEMFNIYRITGDLETGYALTGAFTPEDEDNEFVVLGRFATRNAAMDALWNIYRKLSLHFCEGVTVWPDSPEGPPKLQPGDQVYMTERYEVPAEYRDAIWQVLTPPQDVCGIRAVRLFGYPGAYPVDGLEKAGEDTPIPPELGG